MPEQDFNLVLRAISFAAREHQGQTRKDGRTPYIAHAYRVMTIVAERFGVEDVETLAAAVLHDTLEDTRADWDDLSEHFGTRVADWVALLSHDTRLPEAERQQRYMQQLEQAPLEVKLCKIADQLDNLLEAEHLAPDGKARAVKKAEQVAERFAPHLPDPWQHALALLREQIAVIQGELA